LVTQHRSTSPLSGTIQITNDPVRVPDEAPAGRTTSAPGSVVVRGANTQGLHTSVQASMLSPRQPTHPMWSSPTQHGTRPPPPHAITSQLHHKEAMWHRPAATLTCTQHQQRRSRALSNQQRRPEGAQNKLRHSATSGDAHVHSATSSDAHVPKPKRAQYSGGEMVTALPYVRPSMTTDTMGKQKPMMRMRRSCSSVTSLRSRSVSENMERA